jgi:hypothetical protein
MTYYINFVLGFLILPAMLTIVALFPIMFVPCYLLTWLYLAELFYLR